MMMARQKWTVTLTPVILVSEEVTNTTTGREQ